MQAESRISGGKEIENMDWRKKLTSRKFWIALAGLAVGITKLLSPGTETAQITGVVMALGSVVAYIAGEGLVDAAGTAGTKPEGTGDDSRTAGKG